jgi:hypothetical protein
MSTLTKWNTLKGFLRVKSNKLLCGLAALRTADLAAKAMVLGSLVTAVGRGEFLLKTTAEFLKVSSTSIAALFVQQPVGSLAIAIAVVAIAVLVERRINRKS